MASRGWYAEKMLKLKKETSKQRKESFQIDAIDRGYVKVSGIVSHEYDSRDEVYARLKSAIYARVAAL